MITTLHCNTTLYNGDPYSNSPEVDITGKLYIDIAIEGNYIEINYMIHDLKGDVILGDNHTELIPKDIAKLIMRLTNYGAQKS